MIEQERRLATIMFTDMVGYSALTQRNEAMALDLLEEHRGILRRVFSDHGGREIESVGDGFFVEFPSALAGARSAVEIQRVLRERNARMPTARHIQVRIGLHLGDVVHMGERVHGDGINIAARIEPLAPPGGICLSEDVARQIQNKIEVPVRKLGKGELKNIQLPVEIYRVVLPWEQARGPLTERVIFRLHQRRTRRFVFAATALLFVAAASATYVYLKSRAPSLELPDKPSIAVLPFVNLSADPAQDYFIDGLTEDIISNLSHFRDLFDRTQLDV
jgi:adenylate cyclase